MKKRHPKKVDACRAVLIGDDHESMRKSRREARLAVDESRLVMLRAEKAHKDNLNKEMVMDK